MFDGFCSWFEVAPTSSRICFLSRKHHRRMLALTSRLAGSALRVPFWLSLIAQHRRYQSRSQWFVLVCTHIVSQNHLLAILTRLRSVLAHVLLTFSTFGSSVWGIHELTFSLSCRHRSSRFERLFQVLIAFTGRLEGCTRVLSSWEEVVRLSAVKSSGLSLTAYRGLALRVWSTKHMVVLIASSVRLPLSKSAIITFLNQYFPIPPQNGLQVDWISEQSFSELSHSQS